MMWGTEAKLINRIIQVYEQWKRVQSMGNMCNSYKSFGKWSFNHQFVSHVFLICEWSVATGRLLGLSLRASPSPPGARSRNPERKRFQHIVNQFGFSHCAWKPSCNTAVFFRGINGINTALQSQPQALNDFNEDLAGPPAVDVRRFSSCRARGRQMIKPG